jgi:hypothetical protein
MQKRMETLTHWKKLHNPDYLGAYALNPGQDLIATIKEVKNEMVTGPDGKKEECTVAYFKEAGIKPMILNATNSKTITKVVGSPYIEQWQGKAIQIFIARVKAFGEEIDALRIRPIAPKLVLPLLDAERFAKAKESLKAGAVTIEAIEARYALTKEQREELKNA